MTFVTKVSPKVTTALYSFQVVQNNYTCTYLSECRCECPEISDESWGYQYITSSVCVFYTEILSWLTPSVLLTTESSNQLLSSDKLLLTQVHLTTHKLYFYTHLAVCWLSWFMTNLTRPKIRKCECCKDTTWNMQAYEHVVYNFSMRMQNNYKQTLLLSRYQ